MDIRSSGASPSPFLFSQEEEQGWEVLLKSQNKPLEKSDSFRSSLFIEEEREGWEIVLKEAEDCFVQNPWQMSRSLSNEETIGRVQNVVSCLIACKQEASYCYSWLKMIGGLPTLGLILGTLEQATGKPSPSPSLLKIDLLEKIELQNLSYFLYAFPFLQKIVEIAYQKPSNLPLKQKIYEAIYALDKVEMFVLLISIGLSLVSAGTHSFLLKAGVTAFDISGQQLVACFSRYLFKEESEEKEEEPSKFREGAEFIYSGAEALRLHDVALNHDSPKEILIGILWGIGHLAIPHILDNYPAKA